MLALSAAILMFQQAGHPPLVSAPYDVSASRDAITRFAVGCVNQHASAVSMDIPTVQSSDPEAGIVVAHNFLRTGNNALTDRDVLTTLTVEAREGRFRISNSHINLFGEWSLEWHPMDREGGRWDRLRARLDRQSERIASCIRDAVEGDNW